MPRSAREELEIAERREKVSELWKMHWGQHRIARHLGISQSCVSDDIKAYRDALIARGQENIEVVRRERIEQLKHLIGEALDAWERSKMPEEVKTTGQGGRQGDASQVGVTTRSRDGNPQFLREARELYRDLRKLEGSERPVEHLVKGAGVLILGGVSQEKMLGQEASPTSHVPDHALPEHEGAEDA